MKKKGGGEKFFTYLVKKSHKIKKENKQHKNTKNNQQKQQKKRKEKKDKPKERDRTKKERKNSYQKIYIAMENKPTVVESGHEDMIVNK